MQQKHFKKGFQLNKSKKVKEIFLHHDSEKGTYVRASVEASLTLGLIRKLVFFIQKPEGQVQKGFCDCPAGKAGDCCHIMAVLWELFHHTVNSKMYLSETVSVTSAPQAWSVVKPSTSKLVTTSFQNLQIESHQPLKESKNPDFIKKRAKKRSEDHCSATEVMLRRLNDRIQEAGILPMLSDTLNDNNFLPVINPLPAAVRAFRYLGLHKKPTNVIRDTSTTPILPIELPVFVDFHSELKKHIEGCGEDSEMISLHVKQIEKTLPDCRALEKATREQSKCELWLTSREPLLTASQFGNVVNRKSNFKDDQIVAFFTAGRGSFATAAMKFGMDHENQACKKYEDLHPNCILFLVGLVVNPGLPFMGASPDRVVYDSELMEFGLVEVKVAASCWNLTLEEAKKLKKLPYLKKVAGGALKLDRKSDYYCQVQGQMALCGLNFCDFMVDLNVDHYFERVVFDREHWLNVMLPKLFHVFATFVALKAK